MTFWPKKKTSKSRTRTRTTNWIKLSARKLKNRLAHMVDENGIYKDRVVVAKKWAKRTTRI